MRSARDVPRAHGQHLPSDDQVTTLGHQLLSPATAVVARRRRAQALEALVLSMLRKRPED
jgi:hypothetical protein